MKNVRSVSVLCLLSVSLYSSSALSSSDYRPDFAAAGKTERLSDFIKLAGVRFITKSDVPSFPTNDVKNCPAGTIWYGGSCQKNCDRTLYPFDSKPDSKKGVSRYIFCLDKLVFGYASCNDGWTLNSGKCDVNPCAGYNLTSYSTSIGTAASCKSGETMKYKYTSCNNGWTLNNGACKENTCDANIYPYTSNPGSEAGAVISCKAGTTTRYGYSGCNTGWDKVNGYCNVHVCDANTYPYATSPDSAAGTITSCKSGTTTKYGYSNCNTGWDKVNGKCNVRSCDVNTYPYTTSPDASVGTIISCQTGNTTRYGYSSCNNGWDKVNGKCNAHTCDDTIYPYTTNPGTTAGTLISCISGTTTLYGYSACNSGWSFSSGYCLANLCSGYSSTSANIANCQSTASCKAGETMKYKCTACNNGWNLVNGSCTIRICDSNTYPYATAPDAAAGTIISCQNGNTTRYGYSSCNDGWTKSGNTCNINACAGYSSANAIMANCASTTSCQKGANTVYKCTACNSGWDLVDGNCNIHACDSDIYPYTTNPGTAAGTLISCKTGTTTRYGYTSCNNGWTKSGNTCNINACTGYNSITPVIANCKTTASCQKGGQPVYKCTLCYTGYSLNNEVCSRTCNYPSISLPENCTTATGSCKLGSASGETTYYSDTCATCKDGYLIDETTKLCKKCYVPGDIYYYDGTPIGVVFYDNCNITKIVALADILEDGRAVKESSVYWSTENSLYDVDTLDNFNDESTAVTDMDGKSNTQKILAYIALKGYTAEAATATSLYAPSACPQGSFCGKGEWYLPSIGEGQQIIDNFSAIQSGITNAGGWQMLSWASYYWTSTESFIKFGLSGRYYAWSFSGDSIHRFEKDGRSNVRPALVIPY